MKPTKRYDFKFQRSYFDVLNEIPDDKDKLHFLLSVINKQFLDQDPKDLSFAAKISYEGQRHFIEKSVKGYKDRMKTDLLGNPIPPHGGSEEKPTHPYGGSKEKPLHPHEQEQEQEQEEEEEEEEEELYLYSEKEFLEDWRVIKKEEIKGISNIPRLSPFELSSFMEVKKFYNRTQIKSAIKALFKQDVIDFSSMHSRPKHLLDNIDKYYTAFLDRDKGLYGKKQKEERL